MSKITSLYNVHTVISAYSIDKALLNSTLSDYMQARHTRRERVSIAMDGKRKSIHGAWIPVIHTGMTILENCDHEI